MVHRDRGEKTRANTYLQMGSNLRYKEESYWSERFKKEESFEWIADWEEFSHLVLPHLKNEHRILHVGCGNSRLSFDLYELGFHNLTNVDFSRTLIEKCSRAYPHMRWICDDMRTLACLPKCSFDVVIEKASIEALTVDEKSPWNYSKCGVANIDAVFNAIYGVLVKGGIYFSVSYTQPHFRVPLIIRNRQWSCCVDQFGHYFHYFCYRMKKGDTPNWSDLERYLRVTRSVTDGLPSNEESVEESERGLEVFNDVFDESD